MTVPKAFTLKALADYLGGRCIGDGTVSISRLAPLETAGAGDLSFVAKPALAKLLSNAQASAYIVGPELADRIANGIEIKEPYVAYAKVSKLFELCPSIPRGVHPMACVDPSAVLAADVAIGPFCVIGADAQIGAGVQLASGVHIGARSSIGEGSYLFAHVVIYHDVSIGKRARIHANTTIGSDGFGFAPSANGWQKIHQLGGVVVGDDVEIGANTSIDRGALEATEIAAGVIIDNQVHIAHNVKIGAQTAIAGCVGIAGSAVIGAHCTMGGFVAISGHVEIADHVHFNGASVVTKSISEPGHYSSGVPLQEVKEWRRNAVRFSQLDSWVERIKALEHPNNVKI
jgi:UDP-3-O-[3-hydroxymyristoyl] glucosamine N-acyltransferase